MSDYLYANGIIKSLENSLLDSNKLFKLKGLNEKEFITKLTELGYIGDTSSLEKLISSNLASLRKTIIDIAPDKEKVALLNLLIESQNIKIIYKAKYFLDGVVDDSLLVDGDVFNCANLKKVILEGKKEEFYSPLLPKDQFALIESINDKLKEKNAKEISACIDNMVYSYALSRLKNGPSSLIKYIKARIDFTNIISFYRAKALNLDVDSFNLVLLDKGLINIELLKKNYLELDSFKIAKSYQVYYQEKVTKILNDINNKQTISLDVLEDEFEKLILDIMREDKNDSFDIGPIIFYYLEKKIEAQNIKTLFVKDINSPKELLEF